MTVPPSCYAWNRDRCDALSLKDIMIKKNLFLFACLIGFSLASSAVSAEWIGKARARPPEITLQIDKNLFEVERCMIDAPFGSIPSVYRQPDMPDRVVLAWETANFSSAITVVEMNGAGLIELKFWGKESAWKALHHCLE